MVDCGAVGSGPGGAGGAGGGDGGDGSGAGDDDNIDPVTLAFSNGCML